MRLQEASGQEMWSCREARAALPRLLDGELEPASMERLRSHLAGCAACASEAEQQQRLAGAIRDPWPAERDVRLPTGAELLRRAVRPRPAPRTLFPLRPRPNAGWAAAAALVLLAAGTRLYHPAGPAPAPPLSAQVSEPPLPSLFVVDDEREGRRVILGSTAAPGVRGIAN